VRQIATVDRETDVELVFELFQLLGASLNECELLDVVFLLELLSGKRPENSKS
jgi:hypothetical protein